MGLCDERQALIEAVAAGMRNSHRAAEALDEAVATRFGVNRTDLRHLELLCDGPLSAGQLSERSGLSPAAMTSLVDRLERKGYVRRVRDAADRRRVFVELTDEARRASGEMYGPIVAAARDLLDAYTDDELTLLHDFLCADGRLSEDHHCRLTATR
jgi:DNA-binding MarR family transcriptional regulator